MSTSLQQHAAPGPDYGIDAPGVRLGMAVAGAGGFLFAGVLTYAALRAQGSLAVVAAWLAVVASIVGVYGAGMAAYMTHASRVGKQRTRERLLDLAQTLTPWTGAERVLDVGCGRGLMLVGAARRLSTGQAVGVDVWRSEDQTGNYAAAALDNAARDGVSDRVRVQTGDARALAFSDGSFDVVLSHWVVHNLPTEADRRAALDEMLRALKPGGTLALADIAHHQAYRLHLQAAGLTDFHELPVEALARVVGVLSGGSFRPRSFAGRRSFEPK